MLVVLTEEYINGLCTKAAAVLTKAFKCEN